MSPCPLQVHGWLTRTIWDKQILLHLLHATACPALGVYITLSFHLSLLSLMLVLQLYSNRELAWHIICHYVCKSAACITHCQRSMLQEIGFSSEIPYMSPMVHPFCYSSWTVHHTAGTLQVVVFHPWYMSSPMQLYLEESGLNTGDLYNVQDLSVCKEVTPVYFEDGVQAAMIETLKEV